jgi:anti-anti-sigma regulatory factor
MSRATPRPSGSTTVEPCSVVVTAGPSSVTITVVGEVDRAAWPTVEQALLACLAIDVEMIVVDLSDVAFVSVAVCRDLHRSVCTLVDAQRRVVVVPCRSLTRVVELLTASGVLPDVAASLLGR